jgi:hypothetical protein
MGLAAGTYEIQVILPSGDTFSPQGQGGNPALDSNPNPSTGVTAPFTLTPGQVDNSIDAGLVFSGSGGSGGGVGDFVWHDLNHDGIQQAGEPGVGGIKVNLLTGAGALLASTTTASDGSYHFMGLSAGTYEVQFFLPPGDTFSPQYQGGNPALDSNPNPSTGVTAPFTLTPGQVDNSIDAGLIYSSFGVSGGPHLSAPVMNSAGESPTLSEALAPASNSPVPSTDPATAASGPVAATSTGSTAPSGPPLAPMSGGLSDADVGALLSGMVAQAPPDSLVVDTLFAGEPGQPGDPLSWM